MKYSLLNMYWKRRSSWKINVFFSWLELKVAFMFYLKHDWFVVMVYFNFSLFRMMTYPNCLQVYWPFHCSSEVFQHGSEGHCLGQQGHLQHGRNLFESWQWYNWWGSVWISWGTNRVRHFSIFSSRWPVWIYFVLFLVASHFVFKMIVQLSVLQPMIIYEHVKR